ncbi:hypothetical protein [Methylobacter sp. YRD-M1]
MADFKAHHRLSDVLDETVILLAHVVQLVDLHNVNKTQPTYQ